MIHTFHKARQDARLLLLFLILVLTSVSTPRVYTQVTQPPPSRQATLDAFTKGSYEEALQGFTELLKIYTRDPLYKYYAGVSLVKLERDPLSAVELLQQSFQGAGVARSVPPDLLFWLARAQQQAGQYAAAINNYRQFSAQAGRRTAREYNVEDFVRQCNERRGELAQVTAEQKMKQAFPDPVPSQTREPVAKEKTTPPSPAKEKSPPPPPAKETRTVVLPADYDRTLREALDYQVKADSLQNLAAERKKQLSGKNPAQKAASEKEISEMELMSAKWQSMADQKYNEARALVKEKGTEKETIKAGSVKQEPVKQEPVRQEPVRQDAVKPAAGQPAQKRAEVFSVFEVTTNAVSGPADRLAIDPPIPEGLIYRIQMAVFRNPVTPSVFKGITPVYGFTRPGTDLTIYYAGMFRRVADASRALTTVRQLGFRDAFVASLLDGKVVSAERAVVLEKEWGNVPLFTTPAAKVPEKQEGSEPPTLSFRVEAVRSAKPLKDDMVETMRVIAGNRGLDIFTAEDGKTAYLIGKFITFESASDYADLLVRNGYREARVTAWLGTREIDTEMARQLFERPE